MLARFMTHTYDKFSDNVFIQGVSMLARFMTHCYDKEMKQFVPLTYLKVKKKQMILDAVLIDLKLVLKEFNKIVSSCSFLIH